MLRKQQYNNTPNGNSQTPRNNGQYNNHNNNNNNNRQYNNGSNNRGRQNNGSFNNRPFNNGQNSNTPSYNGPKNGNQRFIGPHNNNPRNTAFYNRVSHNGNNNNNNQRNGNSSNGNLSNGNQRNCNPSNNFNNGGIANNSNNTIANGNTNGNTNGNNGNLREGITKNTSPGGGQPEGHVTINNTVVTHPTPPTRVLDTPRRKSLASRKAEEDRNRLMKQICDYYGISSIHDLLKEPDHAPEEWDNLLLNKIYWLRDHNLDLQETRDALSNQIRTRLRKATKRSDKPAKPYLLAQDIEALNKDIKANREQSEAEAAAASATPHQNNNETTPPTGPRKRTKSSAALTSEQASTAKRQRRTYVSPEPSVDTDVESLGSVVPPVSDEALAEQISKVQQAIARFMDAKLEITVGLAVLGEEGGVFRRMVEQRARSAT